MKPLFPKWSNSVLHLCLTLLSAAAVGLPVGLMTVVRLPAMTGQGEPIVQPVKFDHRHHVRDAGISCFYCHGDARRGRYAGVPATSLCMGCHAQIWPNSPELVAVRDSWFSGRPIVWNRVNNLPKHVFFDHSIHLAKGVGCVTCHGDVDRMENVRQSATLSMDFCVDCHRAPGPSLRPAESVADVDWQPPRDREALGRELVAQLDVHPTTDCSGCHR